MKHYFSLALNRFKLICNHSLKKSNYYTITSIDVITDKILFIEN